MTVEWVRPIVNLEDNSKSTSALARDWMRMYAKITEVHGMRLAQLETPREDVHEIVELTNRYISLCDANEHFGGGYSDAITEVHTALDLLSGKHRLWLARDWMRMYKVVEPLFQR